MTAQTAKTWRIIVVSLLVMLFLTRDKLEAPPNTSLLSKTQGSATFGGP